MALKTFTFCPMCGTPYQSDQAKLFNKTCQQCGYIYHENQRVSTGAVIIHDQQMLFVVRGKEPQKGLLDIPGGFVEPDEHPEQGMLRELEEELHVSGKIIKLLGIYGPNPYEYMGKMSYTADCFYQVEVTNARFQPDDDVAAIRWIPLSTLPTDEEIAFASLRKLTRDLQTKPDLLL